MERHGATRAALLEWNGNSTEFGGNTGMSYPDIDELCEGKEYPDQLYLDSEWMEDLFQVYIYAKGLNISFKRPGHNLEIYVTQKQNSGGSADK